MANFTARVIKHYYNGDSTTVGKKFETTSLVDYSFYITGTVKYFNNELTYGGDDEVQSFTIETGADMPDVGIAKDEAGRVAVMELNISY